MASAGKFPLLFRKPLAGGSQAAGSCQDVVALAVWGKEAAPERAHSLDWMHTEILEPSNGHMWMPRGHFQLEEGGHMKEEGGSGY